MKIYALLFASFMLLTSGCASLKVNVQVYKEPLPVLSSEAVTYAQKLLQTKLMDTDNRDKLYDDFRSKLKTRYVVKQSNAYKNAFKNQTGHYDKLSNNDWYDEKSDTGIKKLVDSEWRKYDAAAKEVANKARSLASLNMGTALTEDAARDFSALKLQYYELLQNPPWREFPQKVYDILKLKLDEIEKSQFIKVISDDLEEINLTFKAGSGIAASAENEGRVVGYPIFDPRISQLRKDDEAWADFGDSKFSSYFGDAQFVLVREGLVVFNIKSLDFDPTPAIGAGTATARLGLKVAGAAISGATGIPLGAVTSQGNTTSGSQNDTAQLSINEAEMAADTELLASRSKAKAEFLGALADLDEKASQAGADLEKIKSAFREKVNYYQGRVAAGKE